MEDCTIKSTLLTGKMRVRVQYSKTLSVITFKKINNSDRKTNIV